jgi:hypothetical protein
VSPEDRDREEIRKQVRQRVADRKQSSAGAGLQWKVKPSDLGSLPAVKSLLNALNDAFVSAATIERLVNEVPVLRARCIRRAAYGLDLEVLPGLSESLARIGNMGLEAELLSVLEDLTILSSELGDDEAP